MSNEDLVEKIRAGETELILDLWNNCRRFIYKMAYPFSDNEEIEDLVQSAYFALLKAIEYHNPEYKFLTTLGYCLKKIFYSRRYRQAVISLSEPVSSEEGAGTYEDIIPDPYDYLVPMEDRIWLEQLHKTLKTAMKDLTPQQRKVLQMLYFKGYTAGHAAEILGLPRSAVYKIEKESLRKLRFKSRINGLQQFIEILEVRKIKDTRDLFAEWIEGEEEHPDGEEENDHHEEEQSTRDKFADWAKEKI